MTSGRYLTTGQAATRCSVSPDTVLKWIRSGLLQARRTAGGHHRIEEKELDRLLDGDRPPEPAQGLRPRRRQFRYCWEYYGNGKVLEGCRGCAVYQMRAHRCYEVARFAPDSTLPRTFCVESCEDCDFYKVVQGQRANVLVVTDDSELTRRLREAEADIDYNLGFADCEYSCSMVVNRFRPDYAIVDCSMGTQTSRDIAHHLTEDPRAPFVRVVLAGKEDEFPSECERVVYARLNRPFGAEDISECIEGAEPPDVVPDRGGTERAPERRAAPDV